MTDTDNTDRFETDEVEATRGREQGLGVGARELAAQRDPGDTADQGHDDAEAAFDPVNDEEDSLTRDTAVLGEDEQLSGSDDA